MDILTKALMAAGEELASEHSWCFEGDPGCPPTLDSPFILVVYKHMLPLVDHAGWKKDRIAALRAEIALLEATPS